MDNFLIKKIGEAVTRSTDRLFDMPALVKVTDYGCGETVVKVLINPPQHITSCPDLIIDLPKRCSRINYLCRRFEACSRLLILSQCRECRVLSSLKK